MTKRLTKRKGTYVFINTDTIPRSNCKGEYGFEFCQYAKSCPNITNRKCPVLLVIDKLSEYEDAEERDREHKYCNLVGNARIYTKTLDDYNKLRKELKNAAIKEFAERLKERKYQSSDWSHGEHPYVVEEDDINDILQELTEGE